MRPHRVVQHDDRTPTGSRITTFFTRGILGAGSLAHIHEVVEKAGREVFRCGLSGRASDRWLEIPAWMFDWVASAAWQVGATPLTKRLGSAIWKSKNMVDKKNVEV